MIGYARPFVVAASVVGVMALSAPVYGQTDLVRFLIEKEAALDVQNNDGATALHVAALFGHPEAVTALLGAGAAADLRNNDGLTPLDLVADPWSTELGGLYQFLGAPFRWTWTSIGSGTFVRRYERFVNLLADLASSTVRACCQTACVSLLGPVSCVPRVAWSGPRRGQARDRASVWPDDVH